MNETDLNILSDQFADRMAKTAIDALLVKGVKKDDIDLDFLSKLLKQATGPALDEGMKDAGEAVEAGLGGWATSTFFASAGAAGAKVSQQYMEAKA